MRKGFSLVELSIVLVILGLLTGGILGGKSLIRASEQRAVIRQYSNFAAANRAFRDKYFMLPGDITNAQSFWGVAASCSAASTGPGTCNGNGDGLIGVGAGAEMWHFWRHLANAGLIEGSFTGAPGPDQATWDAVPGSNVPGASMSGVGWMVISIVYDTNNGDGLPALVGDIPSATSGYLLNQLIVGNGSGAYYPTLPFLKPEEMWNLDTKLDDGKPGTGLLISTYNNSCTNASGALAAATSVPDYTLSTTALACAGIFMPRGTGL